MMISSHMVEIFIAVNKSTYFEIIIQSAGKSSFYQKKPIYKPG